MKSRAPKGKGVPAYFSKLLGVAPPGVPPLRTPRSAFAPPDTLDAWQPFRGTLPPPPLQYELPAPAVETHAGPIPSSNVPARTELPQAPPVQTPFGPIDSASATRIVEPAAHVTATADRPPAGPQRPIATPPAEVVSSHDDGTARDPEATRVGQPLVSILERASVRLEREAAAPLMAGKPPPPKPRDSPSPWSAPEHRVSAGSAPTASAPTASAPIASAAAEPAIEIGHIEVRINPPTTRPPAAQRHAPAGSLTRHGFIHGLGQG